MKEEIGKLNMRYFKRKSKFILLCINNTCSNRQVYVYATPSWILSRFVLSLLRTVVYKDSSLAKKRYNHANRTYYTPIRQIEEDFASFSTHRANNVVLFARFWLVKHSLCPTALIVHIIHAMTSQK
jgi:hypothetical protein